MPRRFCAEGQKGEEDKEDGGEGELVCTARLRSIYASSGKECHTLNSTTRAVKVTRVHTAEEARLGTCVVLFVTAAGRQSQMRMMMMMMSNVCN